MIIYLPKFAPSDKVGFKNGDDFVISTIEYCVFHDNKWNYHVTGYMGELKESMLYKFPYVIGGTRIEITD